MHALELTGVKLDKIGFKTSNPYGSIGDLERFASLIAVYRSSLKELNVGRILQDFRETIDYKSAIWAVAKLVDDLKKLRDHPEFKKFVEERAKLPHIQ
jgi:hypothetical protein